jgi:AraC-like DNA-binding protein
MIVVEPTDPLVCVASGRECWHGKQNLPRHRHYQAYLAVVLSGGYEECGSRGRLRAGPGDVLVHNAFDAHLNRFQKSGAQILNLVAAGPVPHFCMGVVGDPEAIARTAEHDPIEAQLQLCAQIREAKRSAEDWPDLLARHLLDNPECRLDDWARQHGLASETLSRGFCKVFGVTPASYRAEVKVRRALALIFSSDMPLVRVAAAAGFADQAHLSRATRALTGAPPSAWRR